MSSILIFEISFSILLILLNNIFSSFFVPYIANNSRLCPKCPVKSLLSDNLLSFISNTKFSNHGYLSHKGVPKSFSDISSKSSGKFHISCNSKSSVIPNSSLEQIIPFDSSHLIFLPTIVRSIAGRVQPGIATATIVALFILSAPVTI